MNWLIFILVLLFSPSVWAATYHVTTSGGGSASCVDAGANACTIARAIAVVGTTLGAGTDDIIEVHAGTYTTQLIPAGGSPSGTSWDHPFTIRAFGSTQNDSVPGVNGDLVTIRYNGSAVAFENNQNFYTIVQGFTFDGSTKTTIDAVWRFGGGSNMRFYNNDIIDVAKGHAISGGKVVGGVYFSSELGIFNNRIHGGAYSDPGGSGGDYDYVLYNEGNGVTFSRNLAYDVPSLVVHQYSGNPPDDGSHPNNNVYSHNTMYNFGLVDGRGAGIMLGTGQNNIAHNNLVYNGYIGLATHGTRGNTNNNQFVNNTVYGNVTGAALTSASENVIFSNNIMANNGTNINNGGSIPDTVTFTNNLCTTSGGTTNCSVTTASAANIFVSAGTNFALKALPNPAIDAGTAPCPTPDIVSTIRPQNGTCDIGAYEFASSPPPTVAITPVTGIDSPGVFLSGVATATTTASTVTLRGTAACPTSVSSVTWINNRSGGSVTATGTLSWTATAIPLTANLVNKITFTVNCSGAGGSASTSINVRANGADAIVVALPFNENTGTTAADISGNNFDIDFSGGGATWVTGKFASGLQINASGPLEIADAAKLNLSLFTLSAHIYPQVVNTNFRTVLIKNPASGDGGYWLYATESGASGCGAAGYALGGYQPSENGFPFRSACSAGPLLVPAWSHVAVTYDGLYVRFYVNGTLAETRSATELLLENTGTLQIGASMFGEVFQGIIDEIVIANVAAPATFSSNDTTCADMTVATISILRLKNCALGAPPPGAPGKLVIGPGATVIFGPGATAVFGVTQ